MSIRKRIIAHAQAKRAPLIIKLTNLNLSPELREAYQEQIKIIDLICNALFKYWVLELTIKSLKKTVSE